MRSEIKNTCLLWLTCFLLGACNPDATDLAGYLEGHWEGSEGNRRWCVTYLNNNPERNGGDVYYSFLEPDDDGAGEYISLFGRWDALRGGRIDQLMEQRKKMYSSYLLFDLEENSYSYTNAHPERRGNDIFSNKRAENCPMHESLLKSSSDT